MGATSVTGEPRHRAQGFTYIGLLIVVAIMGVWLAASANVFHLGVQRDKEKELLYIGHQFRQAIEHYASSSVGTARRLPMRLEDLLLDERFPQKRRYLRRIYRDPMTGNSDWGLVRLADGQIIGVHSLSIDEPVKKDNFDSRDSGFANKLSYSEWVFLAAAGTAALPKVAAPANSPAGAQPLLR
jgi:type II secretory pathway pseudopilin PulG